MQGYVVVGKFERATLDRCLAMAEAKGLPPAAKKVLGVALGVALAAALGAMQGHGIAYADTTAPAILHASGDAHVTQVLNNAHPIYAQANGNVDVGPFQNYVHYICKIIRWITGGMIALALTWLGSKQASSMEGNASADLKRYIPQAIWGLFFVFFGTWVGDYFISHMPQ